MRGREGLEAELFEPKLGVDDCSVGGVRGVDKGLLVEESLDEVHAAVSACAFHFVLEELSPFHQGEERVAELEVQRRNHLRPDEICIGKLFAGILLALIVVGLDGKNVF